MNLLSSEKSIFCIAESEAHAEDIINHLKSDGFSNNDISILFPDKSGTKSFAHLQHTKAPEGAAAGSATGGVVGGALGWFAGTGALSIPGVGLLIAAGGVMAALSGAAVGAAVGGLTGALIGMGIPEFEARRLEGEIKAGNILISVHSDDSEETRRAKNILEDCGARGIAVTGEATVKPRQRRPSTTAS